MKLRSINDLNSWNMFSTTKRKETDKQIRYLKKKKKKKKVNAKTQAKDSQFSHNKEFTGNISKETFGFS